MAGEGKSVLSLIQPSFNAGELSPLLFGRVDFEKYKSGLALARNVFIDYRGGLSNRPGTQYIATVDGSAGVPKGIPFIVNTTTSYSVVFTGNGMIQFFSNGVYVVGADLDSPYAQADVANVKWNQSADVMTLTHPLYPIYNLTRTGASSFSLVQAVSGPAMQFPTSVVARGSVVNTNLVYTYEVTAVSQDGKEESVATLPIFFPAFSTVDTPAVPITITWAPPTSGPTPGYYKVYKSGPFINRSVMGTVPGNAPSVYGYIGQATATTFYDNIISPDFSQTPPTFQDPFGPGQVSSVQPNAGSFSDYSAIYIAPLVFTGGAPTRPAAGYAIIDTASDQPIGVVLTDPGLGYGSAPVVTDSVGDATYMIVMGQTSGTFPTCSTYFQQRLTYGGTINFPESLVMSTPGKYANFDTSPIEQASDSLTVSISSTQNNTITSMVPMSTGMIVFTYGSAFLVTGGSQTAAVTPSSVVALPQASFGASNLPPIPINYTVLYTENLGFTVRDLTFNFYYQNYVGVDRSILSSHLFFGFTFVDWAFAEAPYRLLHMTRNDGQLLVLTYVPEQEMFAWTHWDTNGQYVSCWTVPEGQKNAVYVIVKRFIQATQSWVYFIERFLGREFTYPVDPGMWFVDAGLSYPMGVPIATLQPSVPVAGVTTLSYGGSLGLTAHVGDIVQAYGCQIQLTNVAAGALTGTILFGSLQTIPNDPFNTPIPLVPKQSGGSPLTITTPVQTITGLDYLDGMYVTGMADGVVVPPTIVVGGSVKLPAPATSILLGLGYTSQIQTLRLSASQSGEDGKRKNIPAVTFRIFDTVGVMSGRTLSGPLYPMKGVAGPMNPQVVFQTGDLRTIIGAHWDKDGQFVAQQALPLPMTILADMPEVVPGDTYR